LKDRLEQVKARIKKAADACQRPLDSIRLIAVTKTMPAEVVKEAIATGVTDLGENYIQEAREKINRLATANVDWHFIGHLQSNKAKYAVRLFDLIHSVDSISLAEQLLKEAEKQERKIEVLLQFNVSGEESKFGFDPKNIENICEKISGLPKIRVNGLMTIAPFTSNTKILTECFSNLRKLFQKISTWQLKNFNLKYLSMGMSNDYKIAIAEGSNMLRIGTAIFGPRI